jgi:hypothetical protein
MTATSQRSIDTSIPHEAGEISGALDPQLALDGRTNRHRRRFSEGLEQWPAPPTSLRVGRFSDGVEHWPRPPVTRRVGSFADGFATHPEQSWERRVGSFADGFPHPETPVDPAHVPSAA